MRSANRQKSLEKRISARKIDLMERKKIAKGILSILVEDSFPMKDGDKFTIKGYKEIFIAVKAKT